MIRLINFKDMYFGFNKNITFIFSPYFVLSKF